MVKKNNIDKKVTFIGVTKDVNKILQAIDVFLLPSKSEGLPFAVLEAQASRVKTIISNTITEEVIMTKNIVRLPLNKEKWVSEILDIKDFNRGEITLLPNAKCFMKEHSREQYKKIID